MSPKSSWFALIAFVLCAQSAVSQLKHEVVFQGKCDMTHPCSQICNDRPYGGLTCSCFDDHVLAANGFLCLGEETIDIDNEPPTPEHLITDDEDYDAGSGSGEGPTTGPPDQVVDLTCADWPCENGGSCYIAEDTPMCNCPLGWQGSMCEEAVSIRYPRFYGNSYMMLPIITSKFYQSFYITVSFKPESLNGRLIFASQTMDGEGDYFTIGLVDGKVIFKFDCGQGAARIESITTVTPHQWHTVKVGRNLKHGWLQLDDGPMVKGTSKGVYSKVSVKGSLYIGGYNFSSDALNRHQERHIAQGFVGCIENVEISKMEVDFRVQSPETELDGQNVGECSAGICDNYVCTNGGSCVTRAADQAMCLCPLGTHGMVCEEMIEIHTPSFNGTHSSHIAHNTLGNKHLSFLQMEVIFKPREPNGILIYSGSDTKEGDFFSITIEDLYISFQFDCGSGPAVLRSTQPVTLHEWHVIEVSRTQREGVLRVDNQPTVQALSPGAFTQTSFKTNLFIGGIDDIDVLSEEVAVKNSFSGDIQRVVVNDDPLELISEAVGGVNVGNAHHQCLGQPCLNNGECLPKHDVYQCRCRLGYKGDNCELDVEEPVTIPKFTGISYMWFANNEVTSRLSGERNIFYLELRALNPNGLIVWAGHSSMTSGSDFMALGLENGFLKLSYNLGGGEVDLLSRRPINDGEWHMIAIDRLGALGIMEVDADDAVTAESPGDTFRQLNVNDGLYLGGMGDIVETTLNRYTTGLDGCIRNFKVDEEFLLLTTSVPDDGRSIDHCI